MPKISAPTVAEHRENQHKQVLDASLRYIVEHEGQVPTLAEVAKDVGLARSSVYQYVSSRSDIVAQLLVMLMEEWAEAVRESMADVEREFFGAEIANQGSADAIASLDTEGKKSLASAKLTAYVRTTLELFTDGSRHAMMVAAQNEPSVFADAKVMCAHNIMRPVLVKILMKAGLPEGQAEAYSQLVDSATHRAADMIAQGDDRATVLAALEHMIRLA